MNAVSWTSCVFSMRSAHAFSGGPHILSICVHFNLHRVTVMATNLKKRKFCEHCSDFVSIRTYRQHFDLFYNKDQGKWEENSDSSEDEGTFSNIRNKPATNIQVEASK